MIHNRQSLNRVWRVADNRGRKTAFVGTRSAAQTKARIMTEYYRRLGVIDLYYDPIIDRLRDDDIILS